MARRGGPGDVAAAAAVLGRTTTRSAPPSGGAPSVGSIRRSPASFAPGLDRRVRVLERLDGEGAAAYLEATSAASARLFARLGFELREEPTPVDGVVVRTMWRSAVR
jgi:hypothetical protein